ncbi:MAG TPA: hypothetical protein VGB76_13470, partial [Pyrinomonadaceae bacterium]
MRFWRFSAMFNQLSRTITALALVWGLLVGSTAALAAPQQQPKQASKSEQAAAEKKAREAAEKQDRDDAIEAAKQKQELAKNIGKPLSTDEDPSQIGKRKINGGFIASMSGSIEKEVSFGRENPLHHQSHRLGRSQRLRAARRLLLRQQGAALGRRQRGGDRGR